MTPALLRWEGLGVRYLAEGRSVEAVGGLSFEVRAGECLAIVGESGSGKTQALLAPFGLAPGALLSGRAMFDGIDLVTADEPARNALRGRRAGFVFQDPLTSLAPHLRIGEQLTEVMRCHEHLSAAGADERARALLERVRLSDPARRLQQFPHELSGGMRQRVMIAMAIACGPALLIADEPTTALDATVQAEVLTLLRELQRATGMAMVFISHDLGAVARVADRVLVMRAGTEVESGPAERVLVRPSQAYTRALAQAAAPVPPRAAPARTSTATLLRAEEVSVAFATPRRWWPCRAPGATIAVDAVNAELLAGEVLGIVGESGSGKSTLLRALVGAQPCRGRIAWQGSELPASRRLPLSLRLDVQMVFQDALASFDPSHTIGRSVAFAVRQRHPGRGADQVRDRVASLLESCGLDAALASRHPMQLSGGQNQRAAIARALATEPRILACDEAVSALDVTVRNQVLDLLDRLRRELGLALLFVTHDMAVVRRVCDRVLVLRAGRVVECGPVAQVLERPAHPYTRALLDAVLTLPAQEAA